MRPARSATACVPHDGASRTPVGYCVRPATIHVGSICASLCDLRELVFPDCPAACGQVQGRLEPEQDVPVQEDGLFTGQPVPNDSAVQVPLLVAVIVVVATPHRSSLAHVGLGWAYPHGAPWPALTSAGLITAGLLMNWSLFGRVNMRLWSPPSSSSPFSSLPAGYLALSWLKVRLSGTSSCIARGAGNGSSKWKLQAARLRGDFSDWSLAV